jgi:hypothetical protein
VRKSVVRHAIGFHAALGAKLFLKVIDTIERIIKFMPVHNFVAKA